jgi:hypothetical protein
LCIESRSILKLALNLRQFRLSVEVHILNPSTQEVEASLGLTACLKITHIKPKPKGNKQKYNKTATTA